MPLLPALRMVLRAIDKAARVEREDRGAERAGDRGVGDLALDPFEHDAVAAGAETSQSRIAMPRPFASWIRPRVLGQRLAAAVEDDAGEQDVVGAARDDERRIVGRNDAGRAGHADQPRAGRQHEAARAVDAGREDQRQPRARGAVDRALQRLGLVVGAVKRTPR